MKTSRVLTCVCSMILSFASALSWISSSAAQPLRQHSTIVTDVLIVGGSPAGVAAALAAARQGRSVVLIESRAYLGTVLTAAMLNVFDVNWLNGRSLIEGIYGEIFAELGLTFDPLRARTVLAEKVATERRIRVMMSAEVLHPLLGEDGLEGVTIRAKDGLTAQVRASVTIDATEDADLAAAAGARYSLGREANAPDTRMQPATLTFRIQGIRWSRLSSFIRNDVCGRPAGVHLGYVWGFGCLVDHYHPRDPRIGLESLNIGRIANGSAWINGLRIFGVDGTKPKSRKEARTAALSELPHVMRFTRKSIPGFTAAQMVEVAPELYVRESRHVFGLHLLTSRDVVGGRLFWDRIAVASYPIDIHPYYPGWVNPFPLVGRPYSIPLRSLVPERLDGLLIAGRAISATSQAAGSTRVVPVSMALGEGAGVAAAVAVERKVSVHQLTQSEQFVREVQRRLRMQGARIDLPVLPPAKANAADRYVRGRWTRRGGF